MTIQEITERIADECMEDGQFNNAHCMRLLAIFVGDVREEAMLAERVTWLVRLITELEGINRVAEAEIEAGRPVEGAHQRSIDRRLETLRKALP